MKIRNKISLTFILLLIFGVTAVSSYAILLDMVNEIICLKKAKELLNRTQNGFH